LSRRPRVSRGADTIAVPVETTMRTLCRTLPLAVSLVVPSLAHAQGLSAYELLMEVENCSLTLGGQAPKFDPEAQAMILSVAKSDVGHGITAHLFYFAPGKAGARDDFGLILDAELAAVAEALPQYAQTRTVNGYRRELIAIGDLDGFGDGRGKALLVCRGGGA
jgi:hypothetical protein